MDKGFLIELPSHKVKELAGKKMLAITDREVCIYNIVEISEVLDMIETMTDSMIEEYAMESVNPDLLAALIYLDWGVRSLYLVAKRDQSEKRDDDLKMLDNLADVIDSLSGVLHELTD